MGRPLDNYKSSQEFLFTGGGLLQSMYLVMDQGHNLKIVLSPVIIYKNIAINHLHAYTHEKNTQFYGEVLGRGNENIHEVTC